MRILFANDGFGDAGGVQQYLDAVAGGLIARGHSLALLHRDPVGGPARAGASASLPQFSVAGAGIDRAIDAAAHWEPDVCFSHNMDVLAVDRRLATMAPVVKFMHGYFGTCISGLKRHGFPRGCPCHRTFGPACAVMFLPRRCGRLSLPVLASQYRWTRDQQALFPTYAALVVASGHMRDEYVRNGADAARVHVNPLFPTCAPLREPLPAPPLDTTPTVAFLARMTALKGGDLLIRAAANAARQLATPIALTMIGDGPMRGGWEALARDLRVDCTFTGWQDGERRFDALGRADLVAVPSTWPEPFGLTGLEGGALGVPAIAFDVGGIREWLRPGVNGLLVPGHPPTVSGFAAALVDAFRDRTRLAAMRAGALDVARKMSLSRHLDRLEALLERCAGTRQPALAAGD